LAAACCCYARDCTTYENVLAPRKPVTR